MVRTDDKREQDSVGECVVLAGACGARGTGALCSVWCGYCPGGESGDGEHQTVRKTNNSKDSADSGGNYQMVW